MNNRRRAASNELDRFIIQLQREYDLSPMEMVSLLSAKTAEISERLMDEANKSKVSPVKNASVENTFMREMKMLEKLGMK